MTMLSRKKQYGVTFMFTVLLWIGWAYVFIQIPPRSLNIYIAFLILLLAALFPTLALISGKTRHGLLCASGCIGLLLLNQYGSLTVLNTALFAGVLIAAELYFRQR